VCLRALVERIVVLRQQFSTSAAKSPAATRRASASSVSLLCRPLRWPGVRAARPDRRRRSRSRAAGTRRAPAGWRSMRRPGAARMASSRVSGTCRRPILRLSASTNTGREGSSRDSGEQHLRFESPSAPAAAAPGRLPSTEPLCAASCLQVQHLGALRGEGFEQAALAAAGGAADDAEIQNARRQHRKLFDHVLAPGLVAALQAMRIPADFAQDVAEGAAALAAAPAIDQRPPGLRLVQKVALDVVGDVARDQRRTELLRLEGRDLLVEVPTRARSSSSAPAC
jgi:hypothetical protein